MPRQAPTRSRDMPHGAVTMAGSDRRAWGRSIHSDSAMRGGGTSV